MPGQVPREKWEQAWKQATWLVVWSLGHTKPPVTPLLGRSIWDG